MAVEATELSEAIKAVRAGLVAAQADGSDAPIQFTVSDIVLDLDIELRRTTSGGGGVKAFVISADARGEQVRTTTNRMTVTLQVAATPDGNTLRVNDHERGLDPLPDGLS
ncbi:MAG TPA: trypco2 family protein [Streptomyces sp.]